MTELVWPYSWFSFNSDELETEKGKLQKIKVKGEQNGLIAGYWLQNLQLMSFRKKVAQEAQIALTELNKLIFVKNLTFLERVEAQKSALNQIIQELKFLASAEILQELDKTTAAQRLKIGTQIGKYHNKSLKFAGVSEDKIVKLKILYFYIDKLT